MIGVRGFEYWLANDSRLSHSGAVYADHCYGLLRILGYTTVSKVAFEANMLRFSSKSAFICSDCYT